MKTKVLFVCMGNICRSPTAEGSFRSIVSKQELSDFFEIDSAGTPVLEIFLLRGLRTNWLIVDIKYLLQTIS